MRTPSAASFPLSGHGRTWFNIVSWTFPLLFIRYLFWHGVMVFGRLWIASEERWSSTAESTWTRPRFIPERKCHNFMARSKEVRQVRLSLCIPISDITPLGQIT